MKLQWPTAEEKVIEHFLQNSDYYEQFSYTGVDDGKTYSLEGNDGISIEAPFESDVLACADGVVKAIDLPGDVLPHGNHVTLEHETDDGTFQTIYCHLLRVGVEAGQPVQAGDVIAQADSTGSQIGSQVRLIVRKLGATANGETEFETPEGKVIKLHNDTVDPADYLDPAPTERFAKPLKAVAASAPTSRFTDVVNIRRGPGTVFSPPLTASKRDDPVEVLAKNPKGDWYKIQYGDIEGWSSATYIEYTGDKDALPVEEGPEPPKYTVSVQKPNFPLRGIHDGDPAHDNGGSHWMVRNNLRGWAVDMAYCLSEDNLDSTFPHTDYRFAENAGVRVIIRWNYSYAKSDGGGGTFGDPRNDDRLIAWMARGIKNSKGVWGHIVGNEPNRAGEAHDYRDSNNIGTPVSPERIAKFVRGVKRQVGANHRIAPPAIDGTNTEIWGKTRDSRYIPNNYWRAILNNLSITDVDWIALHGYSRGIGDPPNSTNRFGNDPLRWQFFGFRMWEPFAEILRQKGKDWERLPIVITETNHLKKRGRHGDAWDGNAHDGWDHDADGWIRSAYEYVRQWNHQANDQYVHGLVMYRLNADHWVMEDKPRLLDAVRHNGEKAL